MFQAINHFRRFNPNLENKEFVRICMNLNECFEQPLPKNEVLVITSHVLKKQYFSSCKKFKKYCESCKYGRGKKPFSKINKLGNSINKDNTLYEKISYTISKEDEYYLWDITDLSKLDEKQALEIQKLREFKGIDPDIDKILINRGVPIGTAALDLWYEYIEK